MRYAFKKIGMTTIFNENGQAFGVTVLKMLQSKLVRLEKNDSKDIFIVEYATGHKKPLVRGWKKSQKTPLEVEVSASIPSPEFVINQNISISGTSKGKGFQGVVKRYGFHGGPASHGSRFHRAPGSVGMRTEPGRTPKGRKLPGHMGSQTVTIKNSKVLFWDKEQGILSVHGSVPGFNGAVVFI